MSKIVSVLMEAFTSGKEKIAIVDQNASRQTTYKELYEECLRTVSYLQAHHIQQGSCVAIRMPKSMEYFAAEIGCWMAGCTVVPLGDHFPQERVEYITAHCEASLIIDEDVMNEVHQLQPAVSSISLPQEDCGEALSAAIFYTSGSTGNPKGVVHTFESLYAGVARHTELCELCHSDVLGNSAPMYFVASTFDITALTVGATVHIYPEEIRTDVQLMSKYIQDNGVTLCFMSPTMLAQYHETASTLRLVLSGSERMTGVKPEGFELRNAYGQTETCGVTTFFLVHEKHDNTPIGRPVSGVELCIQDEDGNILPDGEEGEICLKGCFTPGYYKDEELTAELWRGGWLHTGDLGKILPDGNLLYVNRKDWMVKISGQRVEPGEVEAVMKRHPGVKDAVVKGFMNKKGDAYLCAFFIADEGLTELQIQEHLEKHVPEYMIPTCFARMESFPLNANGKIDRKNMQSPLELVTEIADETLSPLETELKDIISVLLRTSDFSVNDNLTFIGMTSITSIKLASEIYKRYGVLVDAKKYAKTESVKTLAAFISIAEKNVKDTSSDCKCKEAPLSFAQQGVYADCMANAGSVQYNLPYLLRFPAGITVNQLKDAVTKLVDAHPYMICHFVSNDKGEVVQQPIADFQLEIPILSLDDEELKAHTKDFVRPFDLSKGPLFRFEIIETLHSKLSTLNLLIDIHHLIADGASVNLINHELCSLLDGENIEKENYDYYQFAGEQELDANADAYFDNTIGAVEEVSRLLPDIFESNLDNTLHKVSVPLQNAGIQDFCRRQHITPAAFFLAASALTVSRYLSEEDVTLSTISNGRSNVRVSDSVGMFVNTLPLSFHAGTHDAVSEYLQHAASVFDHAIEHESYPFARIVSKYGFTPQISYACQLGVFDSLSTREGEVQMESMELDMAKIPLAIFVNGSLDDVATIDIEFDSSLYTDKMVQHFAESIVNVAWAMTKMQNLDEISLTTEKDWAQLDTFNAPLFTDYDHSDSVISLFRKYVERHPDKEAAVYADKRYTYRELDEATDRLAAYLYNKLTAITGKKELREEVVSIIIDRNEWVFLLPLAVLKTGCAYEPLDPSYPSDRLNYMVQDAQAKLLIGQAEFVGLVNEYEGEVLLTSELESLENTELTEIPEIPELQIKPNDLLLMLYTSGSTGKPKGVQIEHHNLVSFAHGICKSELYTGDFIVAAYASFGFDVCMMDTFCTLLNGGTLVIIPEEMRLELKLLAEYMESEQVTQIFMTTQVGVQFLQNYPNVKYLRYLGMGGEKLPAVHPEGLSYKILNGYGPTENTCGVSLFFVDRWEPNIPLGRPFPTILGYVLDKTGHRLPPGACGEFCVAGDQPARGYLGLPEKTAEVFVEYKGLRMYHTGDVVRYRENGDVEFVGRKDGMVKIRGFRIELKEVEAAIRPFPGVEDVTVQAYDYDGGGKYLAAFVVSSEKSLDIEELLAFVKSQKPPYMVPAMVMQIDRIPLTVNQKVDKKALPKPQMAAAAYVAPKNKTEEDFCAIFSEVLGLEKVSAASDFFEIGGSSIIALKVVIAAGKYGYTITYNDVFTYTTAQDMAEYLGASQISEGNVQDLKETQNSSLEEMSGASVYGPNTTEISPDGYDYRPINALLRGNTLEAFRNGQQQPIGDVLLAGATGYLGIHVLKDLIDNYSGKIYCFVRGKGTITAERRLKNLLYYYFENSFSPLFASSGLPDARIFIIEGDATDPNALDGFTETGITVINCAACVKHFSKGNEIELINVGSVRNLIAWCIKSNSRLVHVSTGSVMGTGINNMPPKGFVFKEDMLYVGQMIDNNQYVKSKFLAERHIYDAILHHGLNAKVMRVGNLAPRNKDGEFQVNFKTNNFMATLAAYGAVGMIPYSAMDTHVEFSPIDKVARAIMTLASTPRECVCFMSSNHHRCHLGDVVMQLADIVNPIRMVEDEEFMSAVQKALCDPAKVDKMRPFMAYAGCMDGNNVRQLGYDDLDASYTAQVLYRLGFTWPQTDKEYVRRFLIAISGFNFFD